MSIVKVIEVISEGKTIDEALKSAVKEVGKTVKNIKQVNVDHIEARVGENNEISMIRLGCKLSFVVDHSIK